MLRLALAALLACLATTAPAADGSAQVTAISQALVLVEPYADSPTLPAESAPGWQPMHLSEQVDNHSLQLIRVWFRLSFHLDAIAAKPWAVLLPRLYSGGAVFLNGLPLGEVEGSSPTAQALWLSPHAFSLPVAGLRAGDNTLLIGVVSRDARIAIGAPLVGPRAIVQSLYQERQFWEHTVPVISVWMMLPIACFFLAIWFWRRQEVLYGIFGLAALAWGVRTASFVWTVLPLDIWIPWRALYVAGTGFSVVFACILVLRAAGFDVRWIERIAIGYTASGPLAVLLLGYEFPRWETGWYAGVMLFNLFALVLTVNRAWRQRNWEAIALAAGPAIIFAAFVRYYAVKAGWLPFVSLYWAHLVAPAVVLAMCLLLLVRFVRTLARVENINVELDQRVKEREAEISASHESLLQLELAQASATERSRIVQDMHDGLGSQLLSSLVMVERGAAGSKEIAQMLRECIDDMRLVVDTLSPHDNDLLSALGTLRFRMEPRLAAAGIALHWQVSSPDDSVVVEPREGLAILRIVQEAIANVLKHAGGSRLAVVIEAAGNALTIRIADDGKGFVAAPAGASRAGRGLTHMKKRAAAMGAGLNIASSPAGTEILLRKSLA